MIESIINYIKAKVKRDMEQRLDTCKEIMDSDVFTYETRRKARAEYEALRGTYLRRYGMIESEKGGERDGTKRV